MDEILKTANEIFTDKIKSGRYSHYDNLALERLWLDCFVQAREMGECERSWGNARISKGEL